MSIKKRSIKILGHDTSISIEDEFWRALQEIAARKKTSLNSLISQIDQNSASPNLSSAIRVYVLRDLQSRLL